MSVLDLGDLTALWPAAVEQPKPTADDPIPSRIGPNIADPTGLTFDRADLDDSTTAKAGDGWQPSGRLVRVDLKPCGCLAGDFCTCACDTTRDRIELAHAPVYVMPPFNLRELAARHITAVELDRQMRGAA